MQINPSLWITFLHGEDISGHLFAHIQERRKRKGNLGEMKDETGNFIWSFTGCCLNVFFNLCCLLYDIKFETWKNTWFSTSKDQVINIIVITMQSHPVSSSCPGQGHAITCVWPQRNTSVTEKKRWHVFNRRTTSVHQTHTQSKTNTHLGTSQCTEYCCMNISGALPLQWASINGFCLHYWSLLL